MHRSPLHPSRRHRQVLVLALLASAVAACDGVTDVSDIRPAPPVQASVAADAAAEAQAQRLARAFAAALAQPHLRAQLRNDLRDSRWSEHKLVLQAYAKTRGGEALVAAAAAELGTTTQAVQQTISALPEIDFYVPAREHRQAWRGSPDVLVAATFDGDAPAIQAYGTNGTAKTLRLVDGVPAQPLMLLQPAEPKAVMAASRSNDAGAVIEPQICEPVEPTGSDPGTVLVAGSTGASSLHSGSSLYIVEPCDGGGGGGGGGGYTPPPPPSPGVYITHFNIQQGDGWFGSLEIQFHSQAVSGVYPPYTPLNPYPVWIFNVACNKGSFYPSWSPNKSQGYDGLWMLSPGITNVNQVSCGTLQQYSYAVNIVEIDGGLNGNNDDFGYRFFGLDGATVGPTLEFRRPSDGARTAWVRFEYR